MTCSELVEVKADNEVVVGVAVEVEVVVVVVVVGFPWN